MTNAPLSDFFFFELIGFSVRCLVCLELTIQSLWRMLIPFAQVDS